jgi:GNAT superfamily N-acetyltransferase
MDGFKIEEITSVGHPLLFKAIDLIRANIDQDQVAEPADFVRALNDKHSWFPDNYHLVIVKQQDTVVSAAAGHYIGIVNVGFINYVATDKNYRKQGLGSMVRQALINLFIEDAKKNKFDCLEGYLGEVARGKPWLQKLIKDFGVIPLDVEYLHPPLKPGSQPVPLVLYFRPHPGKQINIDKKYIEKLIHAIYECIYDIEKPYENPHFKKILESLK